MRTLPLIALFCAALLAQPARADTPSTDSPAERVAVVMAEALEGEAAVIGEFEVRLVELGPSAVGPLAELLVAGAVERGAERLPLGEAGAGLVLGALAELPRETVISWLGRLPQPPQRPQLQAAHQILGEIGGVGDFSLLVRLTTPERIEASMSPSVRTSFTDAAARILARHRDEGWLVAKHFDSAPPGLRASVLQAAECARMDDPVGMFTGLLGVHPKLDILLLGQIARVGDPWREDLRALEAVRGKLMSQDERELTAAVLALAAFEDSGSVDVLIDLMEGAGPRLQGHLNAALVRITGRDFRGDVHLWRDWRRELASWWLVAAPDLLRDLHDEDGARVAAAVNELGQHRMFRREFEQELLASLDPRRPELCVLGISVLGRMGSPRALPRLGTLAEDPDEQVSSAAERALEEISAREVNEIVEPPAANGR